MSNQNIKPEKVTKPIQLLAAWLTGLVIVNAAFLVTASKIGIEHWSSSALVVASIINVPIFLIAIFILQTKFRPEMQEDSYYSKYLENKFSADTGQIEPEFTKDKSQYISEIRENLTTLTSQIDILTSKITEPNNKAEIEKISEFTNEMVEMIERKQSSLVSVNDLLPSHSIIVDSLHEAGIHIDSFFGSTNEDKISAPSKFAISFGDGVDISLIQKIVKIIKPLGAKSISYSDSDMSEGKIYIGSYGYDDKYRLHHDLNGSTYDKIMEKNLSLPKLKYLMSA